MEEIQEKEDKNRRIKANEKLINYVAQTYVYATYVSTLKERSPHDLFIALNKVMTMDVK